MSFNALKEQEEMLTNLVLEAIEKELPIWEKGWNSDLSTSPCNPSTGTIYNGINALKLALTSILKGYGSNDYMTFNQIKNLDAYVKNGEKGTKITYTFFLEKLDNEKLANLSEAKRKQYEEEVKKLSPAQRKIFDEEGQIFIAKSFTVFNVAQCAELDYNKINKLKIKNKIKSKDEFEKLQFIENPFIESILKNSGIEFRHGGNQAYYDPRNDVIVLPPREDFKSVSEYYCTALHELGHATGHHTRLNRNFGSEIDFDENGDISIDTAKQRYAKEELRAETYSLIQAFELGLKYNLPNHASYLSHWNEIATKGDKEEIKNAVKDAMQILKFVKKEWYPKDKQLNLERGKSQESEAKQSQTLQNEPNSQNLTNLQEKQVVKKPLKPKTIRTQNKSSYTFSR